MSFQQKISNIIDRVQNSPWVGVAYAILATLLFSYAYYAAQQVIASTTNFPVLELVFVRCVVQIAFLIPLVVFTKKQMLFEREKWIMLTVITISGYWLLVSGYWALAYIPASILLPISATCPLFAILFSRFILKEKCYLLDAFCGFLGFVGVFIIARPSFIFGKEDGPPSGPPTERPPATHDEGSYLMGCSIALLFGIGKALMITLIRKWARDSIEKPADLTPTILYPSLFGCFMTPALLLFSGDKLMAPGSGYATFALVAASVFTLLGSFSLACAMRTQTAPVVGVIRNLDIVWIFLLQFLFSGVWPNTLNIVGSCVIIAATILVCLRTRILEKCKCSAREDYEEIGGGSAETMETGEHNGRLVATSKRGEEIITLKDLHGELKK